MNAPDITGILAIYEGSDGAATLQLYTRLQALSPAGEIAVNLFRAQKSSSRAKVYRGGVRGQGSFRSMAYGRKGWAIDNLARILGEHGAACSIPWGWGIDEQQEYHRHVLYVDIPTGQVSFHCEARGAGPDYAGAWDQVRDMSASRIIGWVARLLAAVEVPE